MEKIIYQEEDLLATKSIENNPMSITNVSAWEIYTFKDEIWELLEKREGNLPEVLAYMYDLEEENLGIKINNNIIKF